MLRLWNRSSNAAAAAKNNSEGGGTDDIDSKKIVMDHSGEKENGTTEKSIAQQKSFDSQKSTRSTDPDLQAEPSDCSAPVASLENVSQSPDSACGKTTKTSTATQTTEDPYEWAYEIWREVGLMGSTKKLTRQTTLLVESLPISDIIGDIEDRVSQQHQEKQEELRKQQELQNKKKEKERQENMAALITPRDPTFRSDFHENAHRRMSLPSRSTQKKHQGRKSFANILQQWREKSDDNPNAHFLSPRQISPPRSSRSVSQDEQHGLSAKRAHESSSSRTDDSACVTQASKIRAQYFQSRRDTQVRARGRARPQPTETDQEGSGRNIRRTRSVSRSRGDFRTAVQHVLGSVDVSNSLPRSKSTALFSGNSVTNQEHQEYGREHSAVMANAEMEAFKSPLARSGGMFQRSKSAPRSIDRNMSKRGSDVGRQSNRVIIHSSDRDVQPSQGNKPRMTDFINLTADAKIFNSDDNCSIPSHVEIDDDEHYSVADSKLTDMRTECESLGPSPTKTPFDSPWTRNVTSKLNRVHSGNRSASRDAQPWHHDIIINRVGSMSDSRLSIDNECFCSTGVFAGKDDLIDFFLPLMGTGCTCGKYSDGLRNPEEPTSLENILRPWQVDFLGGFGIYRGDEMVKAYHRSAVALATALRQYQKKKGISSYRTKSCAMALEIWAKTCKAFVRSIRKQLTEGTVELKLPNTLYILSSFLEKLPVHGNDLNVSSNSSVASGAWSVTHSRTPLMLRQCDAVGMKYVTRSESSDVSEV